MFHIPKRWVLQRLKRTVFLFVFLGTTIAITMGFFIVLNSDELSRYARTSLSEKMPVGQSARAAKGIIQYFPDNQQHLYNSRDNVLTTGKTVGLLKADPQKYNQPYETVLKDMVVGNKVMEDDETSSDQDRDEVLTYDAHLFYYPWYASEEFDGRWAHWNHSYLPNWDKKDKKVYPKGSHDPTKNDIGANFFPQLGCYSSRDPEIVRMHMKYAKQSGAGVLVVSWYPPKKSDENGFPSDNVMPMLLENAQAAGLKITILIEPYQNLNVKNLRENIEYIKEKYWSHEAFYKKKIGSGRELPVFYLYDSYRISNTEWQRLFSRKGDLTVRDTELDAIFLGLLVEYRHRSDIKQSKFDGFFTYFASNGFSYGSSWKNWKSLQNFASKNSLLFVPSVGPGYVDVRIRPWNSQANRERRNGAYYGMGWRTLLQIMPKMVSITSFNEYHEGTQIEPSIPMTSGNFSYLSYEPNEPDFYLKQTRKWLSSYLSKSLLP